MSVNQQLVNVGFFVMSLGWLIDTRAYSLATLAGYMIADWFVGCLAELTDWLVGRLKGLFCIPVVLLDWPVY